MSSSMTTPAVSVIIQFLNSERYLAEAIRSVRWQTFTDWELVLVDGGSIDSTLPIARELVRQDPARTRLLEYPGPGRLGIFSSRIWGAREARAPILAHLDSDDEWHPQFLERQYAVHMSSFSERPGMTYSPMVYWWEDPAQAFDAHVQPMPPSGVHEPPTLTIPLTRAEYEISPGNSGVMVDRQIILEAGELIGTADEGMVEDQFLWSFISLRHPICVQPEPLTRYRQWPGSTCARGIEMGARTETRTRHLTWLAGYLESEYGGPQRDALLAELRQTDEP